ncbi:MAG: thioesterase family protein [Acidobacteriaceae bacterium]
MALAELKAGMKHAETIVVEDRITVNKVVGEFAPGTDMPPVLATAWMIGFVEWTCMRLLEPYLEPQHRSLGTQVNLSHTAATPVGMKVTAEVTLTSAEGRRLKFSVVCRDEVDVICEGTHERFVVDIDRFLRGVEKKQAMDGGGRWKSQGGIEVGTSCG